MRSPSPDSENLRHQLQSHIQDILSDRGPHDPVLSKQIIIRLLEVIVKGRKIYRAHKEEEARKASEQNNEQSSMPDRSKERVDNRGRRRSPSTERYRDQRESDDHVAGPSNRQDADARFHMSGGAGPHSRSPSPGSSQARNPERPLKPRFNSKGEPLVRGERGWKDAPLGPLPGYKFKLGPTMGLGMMIKERYKWGVESYEREQKKKERKARGSITERKKKRYEGKGKGKERKDEYREDDHRSRRDHDDDRQSQRSRADNEGRARTPKSYQQAREGSVGNRGSSLEPRQSGSSSPNPRSDHSYDHTPGPGFYRSSRRSPSPLSTRTADSHGEPSTGESMYEALKAGKELVMDLDLPGGKRLFKDLLSGVDVHESRAKDNHSPSSEEKARVEADAHSRGERLARDEVSSRDASSSLEGEPRPVHFDNGTGNVSRSDSASPERGRSEHRDASSPYPTYDQGPHSRAVEDHEREQAKQEQGR
jgi:hypothetical protein